MTVTQSKYRFKGRVVLSVPFCVLIVRDFEYNFLGYSVWGCGYEKQQTFWGRKLSVLSSTALSACVGCGAIFVAVLAFAYVITKIDATDLMLSVMSTAALGIGAYAGGYVCGKRQRRNGLLSGVLCGVFIFLIIVILSALFSKAAESFSVPAKLVLTLVCAGVGGVVGVNSKSSRF